MFYAEHEQDLRDATKSMTNLLNLLPSPQPTIKPLHHFAVKNKILKKAKRKSNEEEHVLSVGSFRSSPFVHGILLMPLLCPHI
jgi:hypothetical protein